MRVVTAAQMKEIERNAALGGLSYYDMMENAGKAAAQEVMRREQVDGKTVAVFAGRGNNGGDGFVVARHLAQAGAKVLVALVDGVPRTEDAAKNFALLDQGMLTTDMKKAAKKAAVIIDAIYGTGFHPPFREAVAQAARCINASRARVYALDLPSGADADTGEADADTVRADVTVVFDSLKHAHVRGAAMERCGEVVLRDIGIAPEAHTDI